MLSQITQNPVVGLIYLAVLILTITIHEFAHAKAADSLGDPTPRLQGRITLNPLAHLDPIGSLLMVFTGFGWGKAVQFDPYNLSDPRKDGMKIALAGPLTNIVAALITSFLIHLIESFAMPGSRLISLVGHIIIQVNLSLAFFNLIPIEPLDGFKIVYGILSEEQAEQWITLRPYGLYFLILINFPIFGTTAPIGLFLTPLISFFTMLLT